MSFIETEKPELLNPLNDIKPGARILFILDYPSLDNLKENKIFVAATGSLLNMVISSAGIVPSTCSYIYVLPFANEDKIVYRYFSEKTGFTTAAEEYLDQLKENIALANPTIIVPIGEMPLQAITNKKGIEKWRGSILTSDSLNVGGFYFDAIDSDGEHYPHPYKVIPTIHPRDCHKRFLLRYFISADLKKVVKQSSFAEVKLPKRNLKINPTYEEAIAYLDHILKNKLAVGSDIECPIPKVVKDKTKGETKIYGTKGVSCISFAISPTECMSIPFNNYCWNETQELEIWLRIAAIYEDREIKKIWQNGAAFDIVYLFMVHNCLCLGPVSDTLIKANILYPEFPKSLAFLTSTRTDEPYYKDDGKEIKVDGTRDWDQYYIYNAKDSAVDYEIDLDLDIELALSKNQNMWEYSQKLIEPLFYMQCRGVKVNVKKLEEHKKEAKVYLSDLQKKLDTLVGSPLNATSSKQVIEYLYGTKGYKPITKAVKDSETGERKESVTVDNKALTKIARLYDSDEARLIKQIRGAKKLITTYLEIPLDSDNRLRGSFKQSTKFGRLASSKTPFKTGMNQQNLPKVFMEFLEADDGMMMFELDKAQAEWVASAYYFNDANMIKAVEEGADIHVRTAELMFKAPKELIEKENELLGSLTEPTEITYKRETYLPETLTYAVLPNMSMRQSGKKCNHSFNYGLSPTGFSGNYDMPLNTAKACYNLYHKSYPGIKHGHDRIRNKIVLDRTLVNAFGWIRRFMGRLDDDTFRQGYSFYGQSTVGRLLNEGLITTYYQQYDPAYSSFMHPIDILTQVHDSVKGQYPDNELRNFAKALKQMQLNLDIPLKANGKEYVIKTDGKVGYNMKKMVSVNIYGTEEEIYNELLKAKEELKPKKEELPQVPEIVEEALEWEEEEEILKRIQGNDYEF